MGYHVDIQGEILIAEHQLQPAFDALIRLDKNENLKQRYWFSGEPRFRGISENYATSCRDLFEVLDAAGFYTCGGPGSPQVKRTGDGLGFHVVLEFSDNEGQQGVFLAALAPFVQSGELHWEGEDGLRQRLVYKDGKLMLYEAEISWKLIDDNVLPDTA